MLWYVLVDIQKDVYNELLEILFLQGSKAKHQLFIMYRVQDSMLYILVSVPGLSQFQYSQELKNEYINLNFFIC